MSKKEFWKKLLKKITSRKFVMGVTGTITGAIIAFRGSAETAETVAGIIMAAASIVAYIIGEGWADASHVEEEEEKKEE